jgi:hypothetical protein
LYERLKKLKGIFDKLQEMKKAYEARQAYIAKIMAKVDEIAELGDSMCIASTDVADSI